MKRILTVVLAFLLLLGMTACGQTEEMPVEETPLTWQEQYDLGLRYLSEGKYEEAILAFTAVIEVEPNNTLAYLGRADAYIGSGETAENLSAALADYEKVVELEQTNADGWLGLADVYIRQGEFDRAEEILREALAHTGKDSRIQKKLDTMGAGTYVDNNGNPRKTVEMENGEVTQYWLYEYDEHGYNIRTENYLGDGTLDRTITSTFDEQGLEIETITQRVDGYVQTTTYEYDSMGRKTVEMYVANYADGRTDQHIARTTYDDATYTSSREYYNVTEDGTEQFNSVMVIKHDENWRRIWADEYKQDESGNRYLNRTVEYIWNEDGSYGGFINTQIAED